MQDPAPSPRPEATADANPGRATMHSSGLVEVLDIRRRSRKQPGLLLFKGYPGSKLSQVKSLLVTVGPGSADAPTTPWLDREKGRIHLSYATADDPELKALLEDPGAYMCYFWTSADGRKNHAWLLKTR
jgi:hypothetical protein